MDRKIVVALVVGSAVALLGVICLQFGYSKEQEREITSLRAASAQAEEHIKRDAQRIAEFEERTKALSGESAALRSKLQLAESESAAMRKKLEVLQAAAGPSVAQDADDPETTAKQENKAGFLEKMMSDPKTRKAMAGQQAFVMRQFYADLVKQLHLAPEQAQKFYDLLGQRQMATIDASVKAMQTRDSNAWKEMADQRQTLDQPLKDLLGPEGYTAFQSYEKTLADRVQLQQLNQQLAAGGAPLNGGQQEALLQILAEERTRTPSDFSDSDPASLQKLANSSESSLQQIVQRQEKTNERVRLRAMSVLNAQQLSAFEAVQKQMLEMTKANLEISKKMVGGEK